MNVKFGIFADLHVAIIHDCDMCSKRQVPDYYGANYNSYYSFDIGGVHFVVLDGNFMKLDGVWYYTVNSMSNIWLDVNFICKGRFGKEIDEKYPNIQYTAPYKAYLYAIVTIDDKGANLKGLIFCLI